MKYLVKFETQEWSEAVEVETELTPAEGAVNAVVNQFHAGAKEAGIVTYPCSIAAAPADELESVAIYTFYGEE